MVSDSLSYRLLMSSNYNSLYFKTIKEMIRIIYDIEDYRFDNRKVDPLSMKSIATIHKLKNGIFEVYTLLEKRYYIAEMNNLSSFQYQLSENYVIDYNLINDNQIIIEKLLKFEEEKDLLFLMSFLNHSKGKLWNQIFERTNHLFREYNFIPTNVFINSLSNLSKVQENYVLNLIDIKYLFQYEKLINQNLDIVCERLFNQKEYVEIPRKIIRKFEEYLSNNNYIMSVIGVLKLLQYKEIIPEDYLFKRIINEYGNSISPDLILNELIKGYIVKSVNKKQMHFKKLLNSKLPIDYLYKDLSEKRKFEYLNYIGLKQLQKLNLLHEYTFFIQNKPDLYKLVPEEYYQIPEIKTEMPLKIIFLYHINKNYQEAKNIFLKMNYEDKNSVLYAMPLHFFDEQPEYIERLDKELQREVCFKYYGSVWTFIPKEIKIHIILDIMKKENSGEQLLNVLLKKCEEDPIINIILFIILNGQGLIKYNLDSIKKIDIEIRNYFQSDKLDINRLKKDNNLLPACNLKRTYYCEMKTVEKEDGEEYTYCPRLGSRCEVGITQADTNKDSNEWGFFEIFSKYEIILELKELKNPKEYLNKLAGYVNRLIELEERMMCRTCNSRLISNHKYSKFLARYNMTVAKCENPKHEQVYFNHCWKCTEIIDSRDCKKIGDYYLCMNCGAGPQKFSAKYIEPGSLCPKCLHNDFQFIIDPLNRNHECLKCRHRILKSRINVSLK